MKKLLALVMALTLVLSLGSVAFAAHTDHVGDPQMTTEDNVTKYVGGKAPEAKIEGLQTTSDSAVTEMYIKIKNDGVDQPVVIDQQEVIVGENGESYIVNQEKEVSSNISVTVPLYVCMYGSGTSGAVTTPDRTAYQMKNYSTYESKTKVTSIYKYYKTYETLAEALGVSEYKSSDTYKDGNGNIITISTSVANSSATNYNFYINNRTAYAVAKTTLSDLNSDGVLWAQDETSWTKAEDGSVTVGGSWGSTPIKVGTEVEGSGKKGLDIQVSDIAVSTSWTLKPAASAASLAVQKELVMTLNNLDLYEVSNAGGTKNLSGLSEWNIGAPTGDNFATAGELSLPISAAIAKGGVNAEGESMVVKVTYTLSAGDMT